MEEHSPLAAALVEQDSVSLVRNMVLIVSVLWFAMGGLPRVQKHQIVQPKDEGGRLRALVILGQVTLRPSEANQQMMLVHAS